MKTEIPNELKAVALMLGGIKGKNTISKAWDFAKEKSEEFYKTNNPEASPLEKLLKAYETFTTSIGDTILEFLERDKLIVVSPEHRRLAAIKIATDETVMCATNFAISEIATALDEERKTEHKEEQ